jgi:hypothetical protein
MSHNRHHGSNISLVARCNQWMCRFCFYNPLNRTGVKFATNYEYKCEPPLLVTYVPGSFADYNHTYQEDVLTIT